MNTNGRTIQRITARFEQTRVEVINVENGQACIHSLNFDPARESAVWHHGFRTSIENLHDVAVLYKNGDRDFLGDPPVNQ